MARVELMPGIASISGRLGDVIFRTNKTTGQVTMMLAPRRKVVKKESNRTSVGR